MEKLKMLMLAMDLLKFWLNNSSDFFANRSEYDLQSLLRGEIPENEEKELIHLIFKLVDQLLPKDMNCTEKLPLSPYNSLLEILDAYGYR